MWPHQKSKAELQGKQKPCDHLLHGCLCRPFACDAVVFRQIVLDFLFYGAINREAC